MPLSISNVADQAKDLIKSLDFKPGHQPRTDALGERVHQSILRLLSPHTLNEVGLLSRAALEFVAPLDPNAPPSYASTEELTKLRRAILEQRDEWSTGRNLLHWIAYSNALPLFTSLMTQMPECIDLRTRTKGSGTSDGATMLHKSIDNSALEMTRYLLELDPSLIWQLDDKGRTPLFVLCDTDTWGKRRSYGVSTVDMIRMATWLLDAEKRAPLPAEQAVNLLELRSRDGSTPLLKCTHYKRASLALYLVQRGARVDVSEEPGEKTAAEKILDMPAYKWSNAFFPDEVISGIAEELKSLVRERLAVERQGGQHGGVEVVPPVVGGPFESSNLAPPLPREEASFSAASEVPLEVPLSADLALVDTPALAPSGQDQQPQPTAEIIINPTTTPSVSSIFPDPPPPTAKATEQSFPDHYQPYSSQISELKEMDFSLEDILMIVDSLISEGRGVTVEAAVERLTSQGSA